VLQEFKAHPLVRKILDGGKRVAWGAKAIPEGGYWAMPTPARARHGHLRRRRRMVNVPRLKGIHYAIRSGCWRRRRSTGSSRPARPTSRPTRTRSTVGDRHGPLAVAQHEAAVRQGLVVGGAITNAMVVTKGRFPAGTGPTHRDADSPLAVSRPHKRYPKPDGKYIFDKLSGVFLTGNATRDDAPSHIRIEQRVPREVAEAWAWMCPAGVYEIPRTRPTTGDVDLIVNPSNCVQCGAITAKGGRLTPPRAATGRCTRSLAQQPRCGVMGTHAPYRADRHVSASARRARPGGARERRADRIAIPRDRRAEFERA
jgi:electron-transferring-flavoprotein dehydrogenase